MGFLLACAMVTSARHRKNNAQADLTRINSQYRIAKKQVENMSKSIDRRVTEMKNDARRMATVAINEFAKKLYDDLGIDPSDMSGVDQTTQALIQQQVSTYNTFLQTQLSTYLTQADAIGDNMKENQLEPLKQEEEKLETEKDEKESDLELAKQEYENYKKLRSEEIKNAVPNLGG